jgi:hypothetical protein
MSSQMDINTSRALVDTAMGRILRIWLSGKEIGFAFNLAKPSPKATLRSKRTVSLMLARMHPTRSGSKPRLSKLTDVLWSLAC